MDALFDRLCDQPLLETLPDECLEWLAATAELRAYKVGDVVYQAGERPTHFHLVSRGQFEVLEPAGGEQKRRRYLYPGDPFGDIALRDDREHRYTIRATVPSEVVAIPAGTFFDLLDTFPKVESMLERTVSARLAPPRRFPGQNDDEVVVYWERRHPVVLLRQLFLPAAAGLGWTIVMGIVLAVLAQQSERAQAVIFVVWSIGILALLFWALWELLDWWNDHYIVTDRRVINLERVALLFEERHEAPIMKVENVNEYRRSPLAEMLKYGDLHIETAAKGGAIIFRSVPDSDLVAARIVQEREKAREAIKRASEGHKRKELRRSLGFEPAPPAPPPEQPRAANGASRPSRFSNALSTQGLRYFIPRTREQEGDNVIWRKHWIVLVRHGLLPLTLTILLLGTALALAVWLPPLTPTATLAVVLAYAVAGMGAVAWLLWVYEDWHNDVYILTPRAVIDEERRPLALSKEVRQASLEHIQDISYEIPNPLMMLLNVGHVILQTAGPAGRLDFHYVRDPVRVQSEIFNYIHRVEEARQARESARISGEVLDLLRIYQDELARLPPKD